MILVSTYLDEELLGRVDALAKERGITRIEVLVVLVHAGLLAHEPGEDDLAPPPVSQPFGGPGSEGLSHISVSPRGFAALSGGFTEPFDFGCGTLPAPRSGWSQFVAVLAPWFEAESSVPPRP